MDALHERLRQERRRLGLSQAEFAERGGIQRRAQVHYEAGERVPDAAYLASIVKAGADVQYILTGKPGVAAGQISIDGEVMRETMVAIEHHALKFKLKEPGIGRLGELAAIVYNRIIGYSDKQERRKALDQEVEHIFRILNAATERDKTRLASAGPGEVTALVDRWVSLEVQCWQAFVLNLEKVNHALGPLVEADFGPRERRSEEARTKLKVKMLSAGLIGYDAESIERYSPVDEEKCLAWLEAECVRLKKHLDYLNRELRRAGQEPVTEGRGKPRRARQRGK